MITFIFIFTFSGSVGFYFIPLSLMQIRFSLLVSHATFCRMALNSFVAIFDRIIDNFFALTVSEIIIIVFEENAFHSETLSTFLLSFNAFVVRFM